MRIFDGDPIMEYHVRCLFMAIFAAAIIIGTCVTLKSCISEKHTRKVFVTNITEDKLVNGQGKYFHCVVCDYTIENGKNQEQVSRIFSVKEYEDIMNNGYYMYEDFY